MAIRIVVTCLVIAHYLSAPLGRMLKRIHGSTVVGVTVSSLMILYFVWAAVVAVVIDPALINLSHAA
jgi:ABC-type uncharacterized transport system fused permease/ATPase subunit